MKILVLGGYGLIGQKIIRLLTASGYEITGFGRNRRTAKRAGLNIKWIFGDIGKMTDKQDWLGICSRFDIIINTAGALQNGSRDNLENIHNHAIKALVKACEESGTKKIVQISAPDAREDSDLLFYSSKARGDNHIKSSNLSWVIFRPGLVLSDTAYGGTNALRMLCAFPFIQPVIFGNSAIQTIWAEDIAKAVLLAINEEIEDYTDIDLAEEKTHSLKEIIIKMRYWLGFSPPKFILPVSEILLKPFIIASDLLAWAGWRSPIRSTAINALKTGIKARPAKIKNMKIHSLDEILQKIPANSAMGQQARINLLMPVIITGLSIFWIISGIIALSNFATGREILQMAGLSAKQATFTIYVTAFADIALGGLIIWRKFTKPAAMAMTVLAILYLMAGSILMPGLWADPLGPYVKIIPAILLSLIPAFLLEER